jgi:tetratricopeptide (TPR) repeat protein
MTQSGAPLRAARVAREWSQAKAVQEIASLARERGIAVAAPVSLKTQLSRWENQHALPEGHYRALLCELYDATEADLGLVDPTDREPLGADADLLRAELAASAALDESSLELLRGQLETTRKLDHRHGANAAEESVRAQLSYLERSLLHALRPGLRTELALLVADAATLAGRHCLDRTRPTAAWRHYEAAKMAGHVARSPTLIGYALVEQASVLLDLGEYVPAVELVEQASGTAESDAPLPLQAWFSAARGHALAAAGQPTPARAAYRLAERQLEGPTGRPDIVHPALPFIRFDMTDLLRQRGHDHMVMRENEAAIEDLEQSLNTGNHSSRAEAGAHADLASALLSAGQPTAAEAHARLARRIATRIGSLRLTSRLDRTAAEPAAADAIRRR